MNHLVKIFGYQFYVKEILVIMISYLLMENIFSWLFLPNSVILLMYEKVMGILIFGFVLYHFNNLLYTEKIYIGLMALILSRLVFESMLSYGTIFQQLTLFTILFPVAFSIFIKCLCRSLDLDLLAFLAKFYLVLYLVFMLFYGWGFSFSLDSVQMDDYGPFSGDSRIIHARSIFMMIIPLLWFLHEFIKSGRILHFLPFLGCLLVILVHQHRSVWASAIFSLAVYFFIAVRNRMIPLTKVFLFSFWAATAFMLIVFVVSQLFPATLTFFSERFSEIFDPAREETTGKFRADQRAVYFPMFLERPFFGWTFEGFEMKNPLVDWWPEKSGQHFHEGYMEMLFYHGVVGLVLKYFYLIYLAFKAFSRKLSQESLIMIAFSLAGLIFSFSYVLPLIFWGHVGLCLYYLERKPVGELDWKSAANDGPPEKIIPMGRKRFQTFKYD